MIATFLVSTLLSFPPAQDGGSMLGKDRPKAAPKVEKKAAPKVEKKAAPKVEPARGSDEALAQYNELKAKARRTVAEQSKLAMWCEEHGLKAEAFAHYAEVVRLDPKKEVAWRKLGFKKYANRWMTDAQIAELEDQKKAERIWLPQLKRIHRDIHGTNGTKKRDLARAAFEAIREEKAIPSLYREFAGSPSDQILLIQALERIEKPRATKVLAMLAVYGQSPDARRLATEILRGRPSDDYLELLVTLMVDPFNYEVKPVGGPGSPGVLFVEGDKFNMARFYAPPPPPNVVLQPGDIISYDQFGVPAITRHVTQMMGVPGSSTLAYKFDGTVRFSEPEMMREAQRAAQAAEAQLEGDVALIKAINAARRHFSELVMAVASYATGKDRGPTPKEWRAAVKGEKEEKKYREENKPTLTELVPLGYQPAFAQIFFMKVKIVEDS
jgi:hypothetical protein